MSLSRRRSDFSFRHLGDELKYRAHLWRVVSGEFEGPDGIRFTRDIVRSPGAVAVVPLVESGDGGWDVILLSQYRAAFDDYVLEIPAGMRDIEGEEPEETAQRELLEETGYSAGSLRLIHSFYPSPGMTDAVLHIYLGTSLSLREATAHGPEESDMDVLRLPLEMAVAMAADGTIRDAKSLIGLLIVHRELSGVT